MAVTAELDDPLARGDIVMVTDKVGEPFTLESDGAELELDDEELELDELSGDGAGTTLGHGVGGLFWSVAFGGEAEVAAFLPFSGGSENVTVLASLAFSCEVATFFVAAVFFSDVVLDAALFLGAVTRPPTT